MIRKMVLSYASLFMGKLEKHILDISLYYNQIQWFRFTSEDDMKWYKYKDELKNVFTTLIMPTLAIKFLKPK
jgi:hypothetical protein